MRSMYLFLTCWFAFQTLAAQAPENSLPLFRVVDLNRGETAQVRLSEGKQVNVKLIDVADVRDPIRSAVRLAQVTLEIEGLIDARGRIGYDVATVQVLAKGQTNNFPPTIHAAYAPTFNIRAGDPVTFTVRTFRTSSGSERWDFGDGARVLKYSPTETPSLSAKMATP